MCFVRFSKAFAGSFVRFSKGFSGSFVRFSKILALRFNVNGYFVGFLHGAEHEDAVERPYAVYFAQRVEYEVLVVGHVAHVELHEEVVVARSVVARYHLVDGLHGLHE